MFNKIFEVLLPQAAGLAMALRGTKLSEGAKIAQNTYLATLNIKKRKTKQPVIVGMIGLVGAGKSTISKSLYYGLGATIVEADAIRVQLRKAGEAYKYAPQIAENAMAEIIRQGGNVILDTDLVDVKKRFALRSYAMVVGAKVVFIRVCANPDVLFRRILTADYKNSPDDFFGGAKIAGQDGTNQQNGAVVKFREAWRRTPHHYRWTSKGGGKWVPKELSFSLLADIDTTECGSCMEELDKAITRLAVL